MSIQRIVHGSTDGFQVRVGPRHAVLTKFFAVLADRERQSNRKITIYTVLVAVCAIAAVPIWDVLKHAFGWLK